MHPSIKSKPLLKDKEREIEEPDGLDRKRI
jgi:hypothetical protein